MGSTQPIPSIQARVPLAARDYPVEGPDPSKFADSLHCTRLNLGVFSHIKCSFIYARSYNYLYRPNNTAIIRFTLNIFNLVCVC